MQTLKHGLAIMLAVLGLSCAHRMIPGTRIADTKTNRDILEVLNKISAGMEARNVDQILALISPKYFEDLGTSDPSDDFGFEELRDKILPQSFAVAKEIQVTFEVQDVVVAGKNAHADIRYASRAKLELPSGTLWDSHREFNRVELSAESGSWLVVSGL